MYIKIIELRADINEILFNPIIYIDIESKLSNIIHCQNAWLCDRLPLTEMQVMYQHILGTLQGNPGPLAGAHACTADPHSDCTLFCGMSPCQGGLGGYRAAA